ncbi:MAG: hypothetical protein MHPSP_002355, partial [Paramarteilia canceri]
EPIAISVEGTSLKKFSGKKFVNMRTHELDEKISNLHINQTAIVTATDNSFWIKLLNISDLSFNSMLFSFLMPITFLGSSTDSQIIFAASEDGSIKGFDLKKKDLLLFDQQMKSKIIDICANDYLMVSLSVDGKTNLWDIESRSVLCSIQRIAVPSPHNIQSASIFCKSPENVNILLPGLGNIECFGVEDGETLVENAKYDTSKSSCSFIGLFSVISNKLLIGINNENIMYFWDLKSTKLLNQ